MKRLPLAVCALVTSFVAACDAETPPDPVSSLELRGAALPGDGDLKIYDGPVAGPPSGPVWDIVDDDVIESSSGGLLISVVGDEIYDASGTLVCARYPAGTDGSTLHEELRDGNGQVHFTVMNKWVFYGSQQLPNPDFDQLAFTFQGDQVFEGPLADDIVLVTATENIQKSGDMRKLVIAALIDGHCGAPGL